MEPIVKNIYLPTCRICFDSIFFEMILNLKLPNFIFYDFPTRLFGISLYLDMYLRHCVPTSQFLKNNKII